MIWLARALIDDAAARKHGLRDCYAWHRAVWEAFPERAKDSRCFLFRVDRKEDGHALLLLTTESPVRPVWCPEANWSVKQIDEAFLSHRHYRFDLRANVTRRDKTRDTWDGRESKRRRFVIASVAEQREWLVRKGELHGFRLHEDEFSWLEIDPRQDYRFTRQGESGLLIGVRFRGVLEVVDATQFRQVVAGGIGSARGFGFGLLMLQPALI